MIHSVFYVILAAFGLGVLVFIHELGHYFMARRVGMTVEAFSIGFGKPVLSWQRGGVKWQVGWLPFGGYVRIKGMEKKGVIEPYLIPDGFFGKRPIDRIKVAIMGPVFNILFALIAFFAIWTTGGRQKPYSEFTHLIGWIDPCSELYQKGVRPGDEILEYNHQPFHGFKDLLYAGVTRHKTAEIKGYEIDYYHMGKEPFHYNLPTYPHPLAQDPSITTVGLLGPASFLIHDQSQTLLEPGSPLYGSGIQTNDRIVWVDGELIFSPSQLSNQINESKALLTVQRGDNTFLTRIPRLKVSDVKFTADEKAELDDWQHAAGMRSRIDQLIFIPYNLTNDAVVEKELVFLDESSQECRYRAAERAPLNTPLIPGDRILAVDGAKVSNSIELIKQLQQRKIRIIVQRSPQPHPLSWKEADHYFFTSLNWNELSKIISSLGSEHELLQASDLHLLAPVIPKPLSELPLTPQQRLQLEKNEDALKKQIDSIEDPEEKAEAERAFEAGQRQVKLGLAPHDLFVTYNPNPFVIVGDVIQDTWRTLSNLFTGNLNPKWMAGPVGIVEVIHHSWLIGGKEALFWMGLISLNLALLNLLPLPVLDGGHIALSLVEMVTKKPIKAKTMEKLIIPFVVLLIALFVYLTYHDLARLFMRFFK